MSLYDDLDVMEGADTATIKRAHREKVREHHPDKGGDREKFERVQHAYLVLSNPVRRERYDQTGESDEPRHDRLASIAEHIMAAFDFAVQQCGGNIEHRDLIAETKKLMEAKKVELAGERSKLKANLKQAQKLLKKVKFTGDGFDPIGHALSQRVAALEALQPLADLEMATFSEAAAYLDNYGFDFTQAPMTTGIWTMTSTGTR